jgi:hypothetical protein
MFIDLIITIAIIGLLVWVFSLLPLPAPFQQVIMVVAIIAVVVILLQFVFGLNIGSHFAHRWGN